MRLSRAQLSALAELMERAGRYEGLTREIFEIGILRERERCAALAKKLGGGVPLQIAIKHGEEP